MAKMTTYELTMAVGIHDAARLMVLRSRVGDGTVSEFPTTPSVCRICGRPGPLGLISDPGGVICHFCHEYLAN